MSTGFPVVATYVLTGSARERDYFLEEHGYIDPRWIRSARELEFIGSPNTDIIFYGTAWSRRDIRDMVEALAKPMIRGSRFIDLCRLPYQLYLPSLEIMHDFADRLGISPTWRYLKA